MAHRGVRKSEAEKLELVALIRDKWTILNGPFTAKLTNKIKEDAWQEIFDACRAKGHAWTIGKDVAFLRKTKWPGIKRDAMVCTAYSSSNRANLVGYRTLD